MNPPAGWLVPYSGPVSNVDKNDQIPARFDILSPHLPPSPSRVDYPPAPVITPRVQAQTVKYDQLVLAAQQPEVKTTTTTTTTTPSPLPMTMKAMTNPQFRRQSYSIFTNTLPWFLRERF